MRLRPIARLAIVFAMSVIGLLLALTIVYRVHGSLEWFPTAEQESKVRVITTLLAGGFAIAEVGLWWLLRRANEIGEREDSPEDGSRPVA